MTYPDSSSWSRAGSKKKKHRTEGKKAFRGPRRITIASENQKGRRDLFFLATWMQGDQSWTNQKGEKERNRRALRSYVRGQTGLEGGKG